MTPHPAVSAPAKINLSLNITGRRDDGLHLLDSLVAFTELGDRLVLSPHMRAGPQVRLHGPFAEALADAGGERLVLAAIRLMAQHYDRPPHIAVLIEKNLPVGAGFGGGSSDAATCLRLLAALWGDDPDSGVDGMDRADRVDQAVSALALRLGADVPVCLARRPMRLRGIGEILDPLPPLPPGIGLLLLFPGIALATAKVFAARSPCDRTGGRHDFPLPAGFGRNAGDVAEILARRGNDLCPASMRLCPVLAPALAALKGLPDCRYAAMSGSGSGCFALFDDAAAAHRARRELRPPADWWVAVTRFSTAPEL